MRLVPSAALLFRAFLGYNKENNPILGIVFKEWKYGYGGVNVFFNEKDLTVTY